MFNMQSIDASYYPLFAVIGGCLGAVVVYKIIRNRLDHKKEVDKSAVKW